MVRVNFDCDLSKRTVPKPEAYGADASVGDSLRDTATPLDDTDGLPSDCVASDPGVAGERFARAEIYGGHAHEAFDETEAIQV